MIKETLSLCYKPDVAMKHPEVNVESRTLFLLKIFLNCKSS